MIFQEPATSLNPVMTVGEQIVEAVLFQENVDKEEAKKTIADIKSDQR